MDLQELRTSLDSTTPLRLSDLCKITGFSKMKFLDDIERGDLAVRRVRTGQTHVVLVDREEAYRYLVSIGFT